MIFKYQVGKNATYRKFGAKSRRQDKHEILGYTCMIAPSLVQTMANYQEFILETTTCLDVPPQILTKKNFWFFKTEGDL